MNIPFTVVHQKKKRKCDQLFGKSCTSKNRPIRFAQSLPLKPEACTQRPTPADNSNGTVRSYRKSFTSREINHHPPPLALGNICSLLTEY